jgi:hypothetical protein
LKKNSRSASDAKMKQAPVYHAILKAPEIKESETVYQRSASANDDKTTSIPDSNVSCIRRHIASGIS